MPYFMEAVMRASIGSNNICSGMNTDADVTMNFMVCKISLTGWVG